MNNYEKAITGTKLGSVFNSRHEQTIEFYEHPTRGDSEPIIAVNHEMKVSACSTFFELDDMTAEYDDYRPSFDENGKMWMNFER